ncbi:50S ribosomal protein L18Ae [Methanococcus aeolicus]|jgi:large subunit ribosomal protein LX|uniref:Large ribosomal subunit protein eL20 n=1 Tax=Methanococcus aeolicus (strain ATCC BAA-1280 / DSM 17508 / OCM 812 / Nankai-3) TaxID=419665 RepID=RL18A_META3|nr:50S ribosomal protein L18Ae [Methanococcus aeolicus]A6UT94.1 RecName: Full=Large ribosomal subunit protein eL20; AltName: Full=50S ribosomal protein L18Ae; AltName: Full=50S ribosomal protein L20e; AltName: Full=50S ribosomal protein LX [Methanococcus aeolicus Nankai-3]ABR55716.1 Ribosomal LX protein [Methanococcus aeolicus Nankai-3]UXM85210.1 50S ribosomal protein L18Ae [Methanococcus aeolicus]
MPKIYRIKGKIVGKDEPMVFTKEYKAMKEEDAIEKIYSEIGSKHNVKRASIKIIEVSEISADEVQDPILQAVL